jgi:hypothetical protein
LKANEIKNSSAATFRSALMIVPRNFAHGMKTLPTTHSHAITNFCPNTMVDPLDFKLALIYLMPKSPNSSIGKTILATSFNVPVSFLPAHKHPKAHPPLTMAMKYTLLLSVIPTLGMSINQLFLPWTFLTKITPMFLNSTIRLRAIFMGGTDNMSSDHMIDCFIQSCNHSKYLTQVSRFDHKDPTIVSKEIRSAKHRPCQPKPRFTRLRHRFTPCSRILQLLLWILPWAKSRVFDFQPSPQSISVP